ncbi:MAG: CBS domain-containing protein [Candidatus Korarchaeum sp.]
MRMWSLIPEREEESRVRVKVSEIMTENPITIRDNTDVDEAARIMIENNIRRLIVVNYDGKVVGIVSSRDILRIAPHIWFLLMQELRIAQSRGKWGLI